MSQLLEQARQQIADEKAADEQCIRSCQAEIVKIAIRDLSGKSLPHDARALVELLEETGMTEQDYTDMLDKIPRISEHLVAIADHEERSKEAPALRQAMKELEKRHKAEMREAHLAYTRASNTSSMLHAVDQLQFIAAHHPYLFEPFVDTHEGRRNAKPLSEVAGFKPPVVEPAPQTAPEPVQEAPAELEDAAVPEPAPAPAPAKRSRHNLPSID